MLGLTVRWTAYRTLYFDSMNLSQNDQLAQQLMDKLKGGGFQPNPARSEIVGVDVTMAQPPQQVQGTGAVQQTGPDGVAAFTVTGVQGSVQGYVLVAGANPPIPASGIDPQLTTYLYIRTIPADNDTAKLEPTWANVHAKVLANWEAMAPCMDNWLRLGDEAQVKAYGKLIKRLTDKRNFEVFQSPRRTASTR